MLLEVKGLGIRLRQGERQVPIVSELDLEIGNGEIVGLIGESGSGKSMTARSIIRLLPPSAELTGKIGFDDTDVLAMDRRNLMRHRGDDVGFIFQDPAAHINPVRTIGDFMTESALAHGEGTKPEALRRAAAALEEVGISQPTERLGQYPHQHSGGMLQRVMIATVLMRSPRLIIADEPTTALDLITQSDIVAILREVREARGTSVLFISHDLELAAATCDRTAVMYAGSIVEEGPSNLMETRPSHPYTAGLVASRPGLGPEVGLLPTIPGRSVSAFEAPEACAFSSRCAYARDVCRASRPRLESFRAGSVACHRTAELADTVLKSEVAADG
jgi:oligopeptide/dipeptide ABC transporter ATP-binding protein